MRRSLGMLVGVSLVLVASPLAWGRGPMNPHAQEWIDLSHDASVPLQQAIDTANGKVSGKVVEAKLERLHGKAVWKVNVVTSNDEVASTYVDAKTGAVSDMKNMKKS